MDSFRNLWLPFQRDPAFQLFEQIYSIIFMRPSSKTLKEIDSYHSMVLPKLWEFPQITSL
ncbi:hypothetical protein LEP1GSC040_3535 [Leptospira santarosai str. 2000030832]|nr:hypothetical protein LEP1GSC040_3535 [Leptospira santarosai str. 2000030832]